MNLETTLAPEGRTVYGESFGSGLENALGAAVCVAIAADSGETSCTGWLIAPRLVVMPAYALPGADLRAGTAQVTLPRPGNTGWTDQVDPEAAVERLQSDLPADPPGSMDLAILRLANPHPAPCLAFRRGEVEDGELVIIVHDDAGRARTRGTSLTFAELDDSCGPCLRYGARQLPGSGGAVLYDLQWHFVGLHFMHSQGKSSGPAQGAVMAMLQRSAWWHEIARHQALADVVAVREATEAPAPAPLVPSSLLMRAALSFSIRPAELTPEERETMAPHVVDTRAARWSLGAGARRQILAEAPIQSLLACVPALDEQDRGVVASILHADWAALEKADEDALARWLQAVRWFAGIVPGLPEPAQIFLRLQRRRIRGRLGRIAGSDFVGRATELRQLQQWFDGRSRAPVGIWGAGGVGKSALVAHFLASLPAATMLLWLDFDQAALSPDDAGSVIAALCEQAAPQIDASEFSAPGTGSGAAIGTDVSETARDSLIGMLSSDPDRRIVIVLDSFEAAQYTERYQELWPELEALTGKVPGAQVIVSGRVPVPALHLHGAPVVGIPLAGLDPEEARAWLGRHGVPPGPVQEEVVRTALGSPLVLRLAERLIEAGGDLANLPRDLPAALVAGVLYDRILDRMHNAQFKDVAKGAIVLRCLTAEMVEPVFGGLSTLSLPEGPVAQWFPEFSREAALVEGQDELRLRPEVRSAALRLLEHAEPQLVHEIEQRALSWYESQDTNDPEVAAERVYLFLRMGRLEEAGQAWRDGCATSLQYAEDALEGTAREWLSRRLGTSDSISGGDVDVWEQEAADRISQSRSSGFWKRAKGILLERVERELGGALAFHDAYEAWREGRAEWSLAHLLEHGIEPSDRRGRQRAMLAALIHAERGRRSEAQAILRNWSSREFWRDRTDGTVERAAVHAARVCLLAPLATEDRLTERGAWPAPILAMDLLRLDGPLPSDAFARQASAHRIRLPESRSQREPFLSTLEKFRQKMSRGDEMELLRERHAIWLQGEDREVSRFPADPVRELLLCSWLRWSVLADGAMVRVLDDALDYTAVDPLEKSVITVLALFAGIPGLELQLGEASLDSLLSRMRSRVSSQYGGSAPAQEQASSGKGRSSDVQALRTAALQWCGPDLRPLRQLVQRYAGQAEEN